MKNLIWADRLTLFAAGVIYALTIACDVASNIPTTPEPLFLIFVWVVAPFWALLRGIDFVFTGSFR
jgi:hypothetical protein